MRRLQQICVAAISSVQGSSEHRHTTPLCPLRPGPSRAKQCQQLGKHKPLRKKKREREKKKRDRKVLDDRRGKPNNVVRTLAMSSEASRCCFSGNVHMQIKSLWFHGVRSSRSGRSSSRATNWRSYKRPVPRTATQEGQKVVCICIQSCQSALTCRPECLDRERLHGVTPPPAPPPPPTSGGNQTHNPRLLRCRHAAAGSV